MPNMKGTSKAQSQSTSIATVKDAPKMELTVTWMDKHGEPVTPAVQSKWASSDPSAISITPNGLQSATALILTNGTAMLTATDPTSGTTAGPFMAPA